MTVKKRDYAILMSLLLSAMGCTVLFGCTSQAQPGAIPETADGSTQRTDDAGSETGEEDPLPADLDFGGQQIDFLTRGVPWYDGEILADDSGDVVDAAVYQRTLAVQERLNVVLTETRTAEDDWLGPRDTLKPLILAGDDFYEAAASCMNYTVSDAVSDEYYLDITELPYINLSKPYWSDSFNAASTFNGKQYTITGSLSLSFYKMVWLTYFNRRLTAQYIEDDLYQTVRDGKWTLDQLQEYTKNVYEDVNGDGKRDADDIYGLVMTVQNTPDAFYNSCDIRMTSKDDNGAFYLDFDIEKIESVVEKLNTLLWTSEGSMGFDISDAYPNSASKFIYNDQFTNGSAMFFMARALMAEDEVYRNMKDDYGLLPIPKYDEAQQFYQSYAHNPFSVFVIPSTSKIPECTAAVLEYMAYESEKKVVPAYYEIALSTKYARDTDSIEMLDIAFANIRIDPAQVFLNVINEFPSKILTFQVWQNTSTVASVYEENIAAAVRKLNELMERTEQND